MSLRPASHAGSWYSGDAFQLSQQIEAWMKETNCVVKSRFAIGPHAGYRFCGAVLAHTYAALANYHQNVPIKRIVLMGPSHFLYFRGVRTTEFSRFDTLWEPVEVDPLASQLVANGALKPLEKKSDIREHSWEMHLPYISKYLNGAKVVPLLFGQPEPHDRSLSSIAALLDDDFTAFVISSDFCHWGEPFDFIPFSSCEPVIYKQIMKLDLQGCEVLGTGDAQKWRKYIRETGNTICGAIPIQALLDWGEEVKLGLRFDLMSYVQSSKARYISDTSVSYAALVGNI